MNITKEVEKAYQVAINTRKNAHAPYSKFLVGAAIKIKNEDQYFGGGNVENMSYGATVCGERTAVWNAVTAGKKDFEFIVVLTQCEPAGTPCGMCLQVLSEFVGPDFLVYLANLDGIQKELKFSELMPYPFDKELL
jgi:cytidine deaminase